MMGSTSHSTTKPVQEVGGFISVDTTWIGDYIYVLTANVLVPSGVTLTIEPGAEVRFGGSYPLQIGGIIIDRGTPQADIPFSSVELPSGVERRNKIEFTGSYQSDSVIEFCEFYDCGVNAGAASPFVEHNYFSHCGITAEGGAPVLRDNIFEEGTISLMHAGGKDVIISHNRLIRSVFHVWGASSVSISNNIIESATEGLRINTVGNENIEIMFNTFRANSSAICLQPGRSLRMPLNIRINNNNFVDNKFSSIRTHEYIESDILAYGNWWGTTDEVEIQRQIYDYYDDLTLPRVVYSPYADSPVPGDIHGRAYLQGRSDHIGITISIYIGSDIVSTASVSSGDFTLSAPSGVHSVAVSMTGFLPAVRENVEILAGQTTQLPDVQLLAGDVNNDGIIDISDLALLASEFNTPPAQGSYVDLNADGIVDIYDLVLVGMNYGKTESPW